METAPCTMANSEPETAQLVTEHWSYQLVRELNDESLHLKSTIKSIAIRDLYPKARYHFLVLPRKDINNLHEVMIGTLFGGFFWFETLISVYYNPTVLLTVGCSYQLTTLRCWRTCTGWHKV